MAIGGVCAAVITPRDQAGAIDETGLRLWLEFLLQKGIRGFAINGATGEFCRTTEAEFDLLMGIVGETLKGRANFLVGVGATTSSASIRLGQRAARAGADGLLLSMPFYFPYSQQDLTSFCRAVADRVEAPVLLYNLPQFASGLQPATSLALIAECENIVGIKDSSGSLETVRLLTTEGVPAVRIIGNDSALVQALAERLADGVVSGVACALPELISRLWEYGTGGIKATEEPAAAELATALKLFIQQLDVFPTPWGLKFAGQARGLAPATFPFPLSTERDQQAAAFRLWFQEHQDLLKACQQ